MHRTEQHFFFSTWSSHVSFARTHVGDPRVRFVFKKKLRSLIAFSKKIHVDPHERHWQGGVTSKNVENLLELVLGCVNWLRMEVRLERWRKDLHD